MRDASRYKRNQRHLVRTRHLYALLFANGQAYIGQSVEPQEREKQHRRVSGGWYDRTFLFLPLGSLEGTEEQAKDFEVSWRHKARRHGWQVMAGPGMPIRRLRPRNLRQWHIGWGLKWPTHYTRLSAWARALSWYAAPLGMLYFA